MLIVAKYRKTANDAWRFPMYFSILLSYINCKIMIANDVKTGQYIGVWFALINTYEEGIMNRRE